MSEILVLVEHSDGAVKKVTLELLTLARSLGTPAAVWLGAGCSDAAVATLGEYGAESRIERLPWSIARWIRPKDPASTAEPHIPLSGVGVATDQDGQKVVLFTDEWVRADFARRNEAFEMSAIPFADLGIVGAAARAGTAT